MGTNNEQLEIVDDKDEIIGRADRYSIHMRGQQHREVGVFIYNGQGGILLQRRASDKDVAPGKLDTSVGGHVSAGLTYEEAAILELYEEAGIRAQPGDLEFLFKNQRQSNRQKNGMVNKAWRSIYLYRFNDATDRLSVEHGKATSLEWWPITRLLSLTEEQKQEFTSFVYKDLPVVIPAIQKRLASR